MLNTGRRSAAPPTTRATLRIEASIGVSVDAAPYAQVDRYAQQGVTS
jgi:hypothetical protein